MATGIEMLGQMGTDQSLAGPVQGGNMVVKPNQVPVGGAAMLAKALRGQANKGVGGMYVLPEQQDQTPDFMKIAQSNVMRDIEGQRNQYPGNFSEEEGGIITMHPRNLKTAPGADETTLAYITPEEQAILGLLNPGTPHRGPSDIPTYDSVDWDPRTGQFSVTSGAQASAQEAQDRGERLTQRQERDVETINQDAYAGAGLDEGQAYAFDPETYQATGDIVQGAIGTPTEAVEESTEVTESQSNDQKNLADAIKNDNKEEAQRIIEKNKDDMNFFQTFKSLYDDTLGAGINKVAEWGSGIFSKDKDSKDDKDGKKKDTKSFIESLFTGGAFGSIAKLLSEPTEKHFKDNNYLAIMQDKYLNPDGSIKEGMKKDFDRFSKDYKSLIPSGPAGRDFSMKEILMEGNIAEGSDLERRLNPTKYFEDNPPRTGQDFKDMAQAQREGKLAFTKSNTQAIEEGRRLLEQEGGGSGGGRPGGMGGGASPVEEEVTEAVVEEGATTMPYTSPRTGGAEVNVPLSRRFTLDPTQQVAQYRTQPRSVEDIYKYYTEGTEGEGLSLEPYSEFQKRRRKALGKKPLDFWSY